MVPSITAALWPAQCHTPEEQDALPTSLIVVFFQLFYSFSLKSDCRQAQFSFPLLISQCFLRTDFILSLSGLVGRYFCLVGLLCCFVVVFLFLSFLHSFQLLFSLMRPSQVSLFFHSFCQVCLSVLLLPAPQCAVLLLFS